MKAKPTNKAHQAYGKAGTVVHEFLEGVVQNPTNKSYGDLLIFDSLWKKHNVDEHTGIGGVKINIAPYEKCVVNGYHWIKKNIIPGTCESIVTEEKFSFSFEKWTIKGFKDVVIRTMTHYIDGIQEQKEHHIIDWKTNSSPTKDMHKDQRLFYSWAHWKEYGIIPTCTWVYLKYPGVVHESHFSEEDLIQFEDELFTLLTEIEEKGNDISQYSEGEWKGPFNKWSNLCAAEIKRRQEQPTLQMDIEIVGGYAFLQGVVPKVFEDVLDKKTKFDLPNKHFMQERLRKNGRGFMNIDEVGTVHLYDKRRKVFPIGMLDTVLSLVKEFNEHYKEQKIECQIIDSRKIIQECDFPEKLVGKTLRPYQEDAVNIFCKKKQGILHMATGAGKTVTAAECIRRVNTRTLWIIDRHELLTQTKKELEKMLGFEVGLIKGKTFEPKDVTIATVQTLNQCKTSQREYLRSVNMVVIDEYHKSAADTYQKILGRMDNAIFRLGLTATPFRDDGKTPILKAHLGEIIYSMPTQELIKNGTLVKPKISFWRYTVEAWEEMATPESYAEEYQMFVEKHTCRHALVSDIVEKNPNKKILILTKSVDHGKVLATLTDSYHIHGSLPKAKREELMEKFRQEDHATLVMTHSIGAEGLDIPELDIIINASANKGDTKSIQILGRVLRCCQNKDTAEYHDFIDHGYHTAKHSKKRMKSMKDEGHEVNTFTFVPKMIESQDDVWVKE